MQFEFTFLTCKPCLFGGPDGQSLYDFYHFRRARKARLLNLSVFKLLGTEWR